MASSRVRPPSTSSMYTMSAWSMPTCGRPRRGVVDLHRDRRRVGWSLSPVSGSIAGLGLGVGLGAGVAWSVRRRASCAERVRRAGGPLGFGLAAAGARRRRAGRRRAPSRRQRRVAREGRVMASPSADCSDRKGRDSRRDAAEVGSAGGRVSSMSKNCGRSARAGQVAAGAACAGLAAYECRVPRHCRNAGRPARGPRPRAARRRRRCADRRPGRRRGRAPPGLPRSRRSRRPDAGRG